MNRQLSKKQELNRFLLDLHSKSNELSDQELSNRVIEEAVLISDSDIGFFHQVTADQTGIILTAWNEHALKNCSAFSSTHSPIDSAGNWVDSFRLKRPVVYNDYPKSPNQKGLPVGHVPVKRFMSVPVIGGDNAGIIFGVGNKSEDYDENDLENLKLLATELAQIMSRRKAEADLRLSEQRYSEIFNSVNDGIFIHDANTGKVLDANSAALDMFGYESKEEFLEDIFERSKMDEEPYSFHRAFELIRRAAIGELPVFDWKAKKRDGNILWVEVSLRGSNITGKKCVIATLRDTTYRSQTELERSITAEFLSIINEAQNTSELISAAASFFQQRSGCEALGIRLKRGDDYPYYEARGFPQEFLAAENSLCARDMHGQLLRDGAGNPQLDCMCGNIICGRFDPSKPFFTKGGSFWTNSTTDLLAKTSESDRQARTRNRCHGEGYESVALIVLHVGEVQLGLLQLNDRQAGRFSPEYIALWERLAGYLAIALAKFEAEGLLRSSEELYRSLFDNMLNGFAYCRMLFLQDRPWDFIYLAVNDAFTALTGLNDVVGKKATEVIPGIQEKDPELFEIYGRVALSGKPERFETYVVALNMWFSISVYSPKKEYFVSVFDVITERKRAEAEKKEIDHYYSQVFNTSGAGVVVIDKYGICKAINKTAAERMGAGPEDFIGTSIYQLLAPEIADYYMASNREVLRTGVAKEYEAEFDLPVGRKIFKVFDQPICDLSGDINAVASSSIDITERVKAERELKRNEIKFRSLFNSMTEGVALHEAVRNQFGGVVDYRIIDVNPAFTLYTGITKEDAIGRFFREVYCTDKHLSSAESGTSVSFEAHFEATGKYVDISIFSPSWGILAAVFNDITPRKKAAAALLEHQARLDLALKAADMCLWSWEITDNIRYYDDGLCNLFGIDRATFTGSPDEFFNVVHPEDRTKVRAALKRTLEQKAPYSTDYRVVRPDGSIRYVNARGLMVCDIMGEPVRINGLVWDVTARKQADSERQRLITAIEQAAEAIVITDAEGTIKYVNPAFTAISGYSSEETIGQTQRMLRRGVHDDILAGNTWTGRMVNRGKNGQPYTVEATISPVRDEAGTITGFIATKRDVTKEIDLEAQLLQSQKMEAIGTLAGGIAHDFNNILQAITGNLFLLRAHTPAYGNCSELIDETDALVVRAADMTKGLLSFSRKQLLTLKCAEMNEVVENLAKILSRMIGEDILLNIQYSDKPLQVRIDVGQIQQVLVNLAVNARDAMRRGGQISIELGIASTQEVASHLQGAAEGQYCYIDVRDTGAGIEVDSIKKIFEPFFTTKEVGKGTGLGLAIVYGIVKQHSGHIMVESKVGEGTSFRIYLPLTKDVGVANVVRERHDVLSYGSGCILLVDDEALLMQGIKGVLSESGYKVICTQSGEDAITIFNAKRDELSLVIIDLIMPGMNGREVSEKMKSIRPDIKILFMSGYPDDILSERDLLSDGIELISKPFTMSRLSRKVKAMLNFN